MTYKNNKLIILHKKYENEKKNYLPSKSHKIWVTSLEAY